MNSKLTQAGLPAIETEDFIELTLVDECGDEDVTSIDAPPVDDMTTTVLRETEETQVLTDIPKIVLKTVPSHSAQWNNDICGTIEGGLDDDLGLKYVTFTDTVASEPVQNPRISLNPTENSQINRGTDGDNDGYNLQLTFQLKDYSNIKDQKSFNILVKECHVLSF